MPTIHLEMNICWIRSCGKRNSRRRASLTWDRLTWKRFRRQRWWKARYSFCTSLLSVLLCYLGIGYHAHYGCSQPFRTLFDFVCLVGVGESEKETTGTRTGEGGERLWPRDDAARERGRVLSWVGKAGRLGVYFHHTVWLIFVVNFFYSA